MPSEVICRLREVKTICITFCSVCSWVLENEAEISYKIKLSIRDLSSKSSRQATSNALSWAIDLRAIYALKSSSVFSKSSVIIIAWHTLTSHIIELKKFDACTAHSELIFYVLYTSFKYFLPPRYSSNTFLVARTDLGINSLLIF